MASSARPPDFDDAIALARARRSALEQAHHDLSRVHDDEGRTRLLDALVAQFGAQEETT